jgi:predicted nucleic acid-binding protein
MNILLDSCVIMAVLMEEPEKHMILELTKDANIIVPSVIDFEVGNALSKLFKRKILTEKEVYEVFFTYKQIPLHAKAVDLNNSIRIFCKYSIYAYDAYYLEIASRLNLPLITFDTKMKEAAKDLNVTILEV